MSVGWKNNDFWILLIGLNEEIKRLNFNWAYNMTFNMDFTNTQKATIKNSSFQFLPDGNCHVKFTFSLAPEGAIEFDCCSVFES
jgi:hypothetical protein